MLGKSFCTLVQFSLNSIFFLQYSFITSLKILCNYYDFYCCDKDYGKKLRAKSLFQFIVEDVLEGGQGKESRGKNWGSLVRRGILLPGLFPWLVQPDFLYTPGSLSSDCTHHTKLCPFTAVINQDDVTQAFPRSILWDYFLNWVFLFSDNYTLCQVDKTNNEKERKEERK